MSTQPETIFLIDSEDDEIQCISSDGDIEVIEVRPPQPKSPSRTAQERVAARSTSRVKPLNSSSNSHASPSGNSRRKTQQQPDNNGQLPTPERSPPRLQSGRSQAFRIETPSISGPISETMHSTRPNKRPYVLEQGGTASAESNSRKRPRNNASQSSTPFCSPEYIIIEDDDEGEIQPLCNESSDESDWELYHAGFIWPSISTLVATVAHSLEPVVDEIDHALLRLQRLRLTTDDAPSDCEVVQPCISESNSWSQTLRLRSNTRRTTSSKWEDAEAQLKLITTPGMLAASGGVCSINQSGPAAAFASSAIGGGSGAWNADQRAANKAGALLYWQQSNPSSILIPQQRIGDEWSVWEDPECHFRDNQTVKYQISENQAQEATIRVYYTVTDVKFNPLRPDIFVSSSYDRSIRTWSYDENQKRVHSAWDGYSHDYSAVPNLLDFKPGSQVLAVGCSDGSGYIHAPGVEYPQKLQLSSKLRLEVTAQSWGPESTGISEYFICGGGSSDQENNGKAPVHASRGWASAWILRPEKAERVCNFIMGDTAGLYCDALCVNPTGHCVAIASIDEELRFSTRHLVEFFDLRTKPRAIVRQCLPSSDKRLSSAVVCSAFSPDGIYYACSREDNTAQVWDWRWMAKNSTSIRTLEHRPSDRRNVRHSYGVTAMTWVAHDGASSTPLLVTGGDDGKIIQWDMRRSESHLLAELETSVGTFSVGDHHKGEMPLIAGDCDGKVYIYDSRQGAIGRSSRLP